MKFQFFKFGFVIWGGERGVMVGFPLDFWKVKLDEYDERMNK